MSDYRETFEQLLARNKNKKPRKHPSDEEHRLQAACVRWFRLQYPALRNNLFAVPNGGRRDKATGAKLKEEGVVAGVSDLILLCRNETYGALLIEMKTPAGSQSPSQKEWQNTMESDGYHYVVCRSIEDFRREVDDYLKNQYIHIR